jgi:hypothetical protein
MLALSIVCHSDISEYISASPSHLCLVLVHMSQGKTPPSGCHDALNLQQIIVGIQCDGRHPPVPHSIFAYPLLL